MRLPYLLFNYEDIIPLPNNIYTMQIDTLHSDFEFSELSYEGKTYLKSFAIVLTTYETQCQIIALCDVISTDDTSIYFKVFGRGRILNINMDYVNFESYDYIDLPPMYENNIELILNRYKHLNIYKDISFNLLEPVLSSLDYLAEKVFAEPDDKIFYFESNNIKASMCLFYECYFLLKDLSSAKDNNYPKEVLAKIKKEQSLQNFYPQGSQEAAKIQEYLDLLKDIPWKKHSINKSSYQDITRDIDASHYGLHATKNKILDIIAYETLCNEPVSTALLFVGPPGTGKTTFAKSLASILSRDYIYIPVGSMTDDTELKGHRRTYVGSRPGSLVTSLTKIKTINPLIVLDEIDKVKDLKSSITAVLLELLDFKQNQEYKDRFLEVPLDLSKCLFVCTANSTSTISKPLLNRLLVIDFPQYSYQEKVAIINDYMIPSLSVSIENWPSIYSLSTSLKEYLAKKYTLREIESLLSMIFRRNARAHIDSKIPSLTTLEDFLSSDILTKNKGTKIGF